MKFKLFIAESVQIKGDVIIAYFIGDEKKQHFKINCSFNAFQSGIRLWDTWELNIKFRTEILENTETQEKIYNTHFDCDKAKVIDRLQDEHKSGK